MTEILFTTCNRWPDLSASDQLAAAALTQLGHTVLPVCWQDDFARFRQADLIVLRAHWDYHYDLPGFTDWLDRLTAETIPVQNPLGLVRWNLDKGYLLDLQANGIRIPTTARLAPDDDPHAIYRHYGWVRAVIKPIAGASGHLVERVAYAELPQWETQIRPQRAGGAWLIQEFRPEIAQGELSLIFIDGCFSHAVAKQPSAGEYRINSKYGGQISRTQPTDAVIAQAQHALTRLPQQPLYARVDGVVTAAGDFYLIELEVNEPGLYFPHAPEQAARFAQAIHDKLI